MKSFDENDLIACSMHELSPRRERALRRRLESDAALTAEFVALDEMLHGFRHDDAMFPVSDDDLDSMWQKVRPKLTPLRPAPWILENEWKLALASGLALAGGTAMVMLSLRHDALHEAAKRPFHEAPIGSALEARSRTASQTPHWYNNRPGPLTTAPRNLMIHSTFVLPPAQQETVAEVEQPTETALSLPMEEKPPMLTAIRFSEPRNPDASSPAHNVTSAKESDVSIGVLGDFTAGRSSGYTTGSGSTLSSETRSQTGVPSVGVRASFHRQFRPWLGYEVAGSYTQTTFNYTYGASNAYGAFFQRGGISANVYEATGAFVVQGPKVKRLSTFAKLGTGVLEFVPTTDTTSASHVFRSTGLAGVGIQTEWKRHWALRAEYRGLFFKAPDFRNTNPSIPVTNRFTLSSQPTISLVYRFGGAKPKP